MPGGEPEQYSRSEFFLVDIGGGPSADSTDGSWDSVRIPSLTIHEAPATVGGDQMARHNLGSREWSDMVLVGPVTSSRKAMLEWYKDIQEKGASDSKARRDVSVILNNPDNTEKMRWDFTGCLIVGYELTPLESGPDELCTETVTIMVSDSLNFLK
jgi:phage tail-like protein